MSLFRRGVDSVIASRNRMFRFTNKTQSSKESVPRFRSNVESVRPHTPRERDNNTPRVTDKMIEDLLSKSVAPATARLKATIERKFCSILEHNGLSSGKFTVKKVLVFITTLLKEGKTYDTIVKYTNEILLAQRQKGSVLNLAEHETIKRAKRACERIVGRAKPTRAVTLSMIQLNTLSKLSADHSSGIVLVLVGVAALLRLKELVSLKRKDVKFLDSSTCEIFVQESKTDQGRRGAKVHFGCVSKGSRTQCKKTFCPFHRLKRFYEETEYQLSLFNLSYSQAAKTVKKLLTTLTGTQVDARTSSHALRRTGVMMLLDAGISVSMISELGRWSDTRMVETVYCRGRSDRAEVEASLTKRMFSF
jgi:integrase